MRWVSDPATLAWLATSPALEWDEHNMAKLTKHRVTMVEIEELFAGDFVFSGRIVEPPMWSRGGSRSARRPADDVSPLS